MNSQGLTPSPMNQPMALSPYQSVQYQVPYAPTAPHSRKRSRTDDQASEYPSYQAPDVPSEATTLRVPTDTGMQAHHMQSSASAHLHPRRSLSRSRSPKPPLTSPSLLQTSNLDNSTPGVQVLQHHHHRLPTQAPSIKPVLHGSSPSASRDTGSANMVGKPGMPSPALKPKGPKLKFTREDDALLVELKETKDLTWKQIADFFPGRSSGTLQVRYCTKLKAKTTAWSDEMVSQICFSAAVLHACRRQKLSEIAFVSVGQERGQCSDSLCSCGKTCHPRSRAMLPFCSLYSGWIHAKGLAVHGMEWIMQ